MPRHPLARIVRSLGIVTVALGLALALAAPASQAATWTGVDVEPPSGISSSADTVVFHGSSFTAYTGLAPDYRPRILRHDASGAAVWSRELPGACRSTNSYSSSISAIVAYGQLHVFSSREASDGLCHAWSTDGATFHNEYLGRGVSGSDGIATAIWAGQLHVVAQAVDGGVAHTWYDAAAGAWGSEKLDGAGTGDDMSPVSQAAIGAYGGQFHAVYMTSAGGLRDRWWDPAGGRWNWTTTFSGMLLFGQQWAGLDVETTYAGQFHIVYVGLDASVRQAWYDPTAGTWHDATLSGSEEELASEYSRIQAAVYGGQFHVFFAPESVLAIGHLWWDPTAGAWLGDELDTNESHPILALDVTTDAGVLDLTSSDAYSIGLRRVRFS